MKAEDIRREYFDLMFRKPISKSVDIENEFSNEYVFWLESKYAKLKNLESKYDKLLKQVQNKDKLSNDRQEPS